MLATSAESSALSLISASCALGSLQTLSMQTHKYTVGRWLCWNYKLILDIVLDIHNLYTQESRIIIVRIVQIAAKLIAYIILECSKTAWLRPLGNMLTGWERNKINFKLPIRNPNHFKNISIPAIYTWHVMLANNLCNAANHAEISNNLWMVSHCHANKVTFLGTISW